MPETRAQQRRSKQEEQAVFTLAVETEIEPSTPFDIPGEPRDTPEQQEESVNTPAVERDEQPRWEEEIEISVEDKIFPLCWLPIQSDNNRGLYRNLKRCWVQSSHTSYQKMWKDHYQRKKLFTN